MPLKRTANGPAEASGAARRHPRLSIIVSGGDAAGRAAVRAALGEDFIIDELPGVADAVAAVRAGDVDGLVVVASEAGAAARDIPDAARLPSVVATTTASVAVPPGVRAIPLDSADAGSALRAALRQAVIAYRRGESRRRRALEAAHLAAVVAASPDAIVSCAADGRTVLSWSPGAERLFGYAAAEVLGRDFDALVVPVELRSDRHHHVDRISRDRGSTTFVTERLHRSGARILVEVAASPMLDERGGVIGYSVIFRDAASRRRDEENLRRQAARQRLLLELSSELITAHGQPEDVTRIAFRKLSPSLSADVCLNYRLDAAAGRLRLVFQEGAPDDMLPLIAEIEVGAAFCGLVAAESAPLIADADRIANDARGVCARALGLGAYVCHPLIAADGSVLGTLSFGSRARTSFLPEEVTKLQTASNIVAQAWERLAAEAALRRGDDRFRLAVTAARALVYEIDLVGGGSAFTHGVEQVTGYPDGGRLDGAWWREIIHPDDLERRAATMAPAMANGGRFQCEYRVRHAEGRWIWVSDSAEVMLGPSGEPARMAGAILDITERKQADIALRDSHARLKAAMEVAGTAAWGVDERTGVSMWTPEAKALFGLPEDAEITATSFLELVHREDRPRCREAWTAAHRADGSGGAYRLEYRIRRADDGCERWISSRAVVEFEDGEPMRVVGVLSDVTDRKIADDRLRASEAFRRSIFESSPDCVKILGADGSLEEMNANGLCLLQIDDFETLRGKPWTELWPPETRPVVTDAMARARAGETVNFQAFCPTLRGESRWWDVSVSALASGDSTRLVAASRDVTELRRAAETMRAARDTFRHLVENSPFGVYVVDSDFRLAQVSAGAGKVFANVHPLVGRDFAEIMHILWREPFASEAVARFRHTLATGQTYEAPGTVERRNNIDVVESYDWKIERIVMPDGRFGVVCHFYDLSERVRYEAALRESETRLRLALDSASLGWWGFDPATQVCRFDARFAEIYGIEATEIAGDELFARLWPEDTEAVQAAFEAAVDVRDPRPLSSEYRIRRSDGEIRWVETHGAAAFEGEGEDRRLVDVVGTIADVTDRKRAEMNLRESEERFRTIVTTAHGGIVSVDREGVTMFVNPRFAEMLGAKPEDIVGRPLMEFMFVEDRVAAREHIEVNLAGGSEEFEFRFRHVEGARLPVLIATAPMRGRGDEVVGALASVVDLSERKRAEERQMLMMRELAHRGRNLISVIQSVAGFSFSSAATLAEAREAFVGRLHALANTYGNLIDAGFEGAWLHEIVSAELEAFGERSRVSGPRLRLTAKAAQTFTLLVHELATNAAKHGSLSAPGGSLSLSWSLEGEGEDERFRFRWRETGGPPAIAPKRRGFGTSLLTRVVGIEFKCQPKVDYAATGLDYAIDAPLAVIGRVIADSAVRQKLTSAKLIDFHDSWAKIREDGAAPPFRAFDRARFSETGGLTLAEVGIDGGVHFVEIGRALTEWLGDKFGASRAPRDDADELREAFRRCAISGAPVYENARFDFGAPVMFERLLVPFTNGGRRVTHVAGLAVFSGDHGTRVARGQPSPP